jgi:hypothetical protein
VVLVTVVLDSRPHATACRTAITATLAPSWTAYDYGKVPGADGNPGTLPNIYALVSVERRYNPTLRLSAQSGAVGWRVAVRVVGRTVDEARWALSRVADALNEQRLTVGAQTTTPLQFESEQSPEPDDGRFSALTLYTYSL